MINLSNSEIVTIGELFCDSDSELVRAITECAELVGILPYIVKTTNQFLTTQKRLSVRQLKEYVRLSLLLDKLHDKLVKGSYNYLGALALICESKELIDRLLEMQRLLFADGLSIIKKSYRVEAGEAKLRKARITEEHRNFLESLPTPEGNMADVIDRLNEAAIELGKVEDLKIDEAARKDGPSARELMELRHKWTRIFNTFLSIVNVMDEVPAPVQQLVQRIDAIEKAVQRRKKDKAVNLPEPKEPENSEEDNTSVPPHTHEELEKTTETD